MREHTTFYEGLTMNLGFWWLPTDLFRLFKRVLDIFDDVCNVLCTNGQRKCQFHLISQGNHTSTTYIERVGLSACGIFSKEFPSFWYHIKWQQRIASLWSRKWIRDNQVAFDEMPKSLLRPTCSIFLLHTATNEQFAAAIFSISKVCSNMNSKSRRYFAETSAGAEAHALQIVKACSSCHEYEVFIPEIDFGIIRWKFHPQH